MSDAPVFSRSLVNLSEWLSYTWEERTFHGKHVLLWIVFMHLVVFSSRILNGLFYSCVHHIQESRFQLWLAVSQFKYTDGQIKAVSDLFASSVCAYVPLGGVKRGLGVWHSVTYCARLWCEWHREWERDCVCYTGKCNKGTWKYIYIRKKKENHPKIPQKQSPPKAVNVSCTELTVHGV